MWHRKHRFLLYHVLFLISPVSTASSLSVAIVEKLFDDNWKALCLAPSLIQSDCHLGCHLSCSKTVGRGSLCGWCRSKSQHLLKALVGRLEHRRKALWASILIFSSPEPHCIASFKFLEGIAFTFGADTTTGEEESYYKH